LDAQKRGNNPVLRLTAPNAHQIAAFVIADQDKPCKRGRGILLQPIVTRRILPKG
jgi:hypothetical protein